MPFLKLKEKSQTPGFVYVREEQVVAVEDFYGGSRLSLSGGCQVTVEEAPEIVFSLMREVIYSRPVPTADTAEPTADTADTAAPLHPAPIRRDHSGLF